jgi:hypothetical protein
MGEEALPEDGGSGRALMTEARFDTDVEEDRIRKMWAGLEDFHKPGSKGARDFVIFLEPADIGGPIGMSGAMGAVLADVAARTKRMQGSEVLFVSGMHHVGVSTPWLLKKKLDARPEGEEEDPGPAVGWGELREWKSRIGAEIADQYRNLGIRLRRRSRGISAVLRGRPRLPSEAPRTLVSQLCRSIDPERNGRVGNHRYGPSRALPDRRGGGEVPHRGHDGDRDHRR